jgi:pyrroline-5-carboxylate reductase
MILATPSAPLALFGCGNMGRAMLDGWLAGGMDPKAFVVIDPYVQNLPEGVHHYSSAQAAGQQFGTVLLGVKPQMLGDLASDIESIAAPNAIILSLLAGIVTETLAMRFPGRHIVRIMPNLAVAMGKAPIGIWSETKAPYEAPINALLSPLGSPIWLTAEEDMNNFTALAGCGPAFVYRFIDALAKAGADLGLNPDQADAIAMAMIDGAVALAKASSDSPAVLAAKVASPGGMTAEGLSILDKDDALLRLLETTLKAARDKGMELAESAKTQR